ncbi:MAG: hypothetical protein LBD38_02570, partial [Streptococcaceae bacterium]|jgi:hypothetical protein|nr:hypothetical protein [Streptococcaceae bacterium]
MFLYLQEMFIPHFTTQDVETIKTKLFQFKLKNINHPTIMLVERFLEFVSLNLKLNLDSDKAYLLMGNLFNISQTYYILESQFPDFEVLTSSLYSNISVHDLVEKEVTAFFDGTLKSRDLSVFVPTKAVLNRRFTNFVTPLYMEKDNESKIKVGLAIERNISLIQRVQAFLQSLNFVEMENFDGSRADEYDMVITSTTRLKKDYPDANIFFWGLDSGEQELLKLYHKLQNMKFA